MPKLNNEFVLGGILGFFLHQYFFVFLLGITTGVLVQENFGSFPNLFRWIGDRIVANGNLFYNQYVTKGTNQPVEEKTNIHEICETENNIKKQD